MKRPLRLPSSVLPDREIARENVRRHHWRRYFECVRAGDKVRAAYHRLLAISVQPKAE